MWWRHTKHNAPLPKLCFKKCTCSIQSSSIGTSEAPVINFLDNGITHGLPDPTGMFRTDRSWSTPPQKAIISTLSTFLSHVKSFMSFPSSEWSDIWYVLETLVLIALFSLFSVLHAVSLKRWANSSRFWSEAQITDATVWTACLSPLILAVSMDFWSKDLLLASFWKEWSVEVRCRSSRDVIFTFSSSVALEEDVLPNTTFPNMFFFVFSSATFLYISCYLFLTISLFILLLFQLLVQSCLRSSLARFPLSDQEVSVLSNISHLKSICMRHWTDLENMKWKASLFLFCLSVFLLRFTHCNQVFQLLDCSPFIPHRNSCWLIWTGNSSFSGPTKYISDCLLVAVA